MRQIDKILIQCFIMIMVVVAMSSQLLAKTNLYQANKEVDQGRQILITFDQKLKDKPSDQVLKVDQNKRFFSDNVSEFTIAYQDNSEANKKTYRIGFFIDGHMARFYDQQMIPFQINWDFTGFPDGEHEVKIEVEDNEHYLLARETQTVMVKNKPITVSQSLEMKK